MTEQYMPLLAESYTAYGKKSIYRNWLRQMRQSIIIDADASLLSAIFHRLLQSLDSHVLWALFRASNPEILSGVVLPNENIAVIGQPRNWNYRPSNTITHTLVVPGHSQNNEEVVGQKVPQSIYRHLFIAKEYLRDLEILWTGVQSLRRQIDALEHELIHSLDLSAPFYRTSTAETYHAFHSSLTSHGPFSVASATALVKVKRTLITSPPGSPISSMLKRVAQKATRMGHRVLLLHCGLDPSHIDHVYFPDLSWLVSHNLAPHSQVPTPHDHVIDLTDGFTGDRTHLLPKIEKFLYLYADAYNQAWEDFSHLSDPCSRQSDPAEIEFWTQQILALDPFKDLT